MKQGKGSSFERKICKLLSEWWTDGARQDVFWRTAGSGARATVRGKKGSTTANSVGDIAALDPIGQPLIDLMVIELKKGYNKHSIADLFDRPDRAKLPLYGQWIKKLVHECLCSKRPHWLLIVQRDRREPMVFCNDCLLWDFGRTYEAMFFTATVDLRDKVEPLAGFQLWRFLEIVKPYHIKTLWEQKCQKKSV